MTRAEITTAVRNIVNEMSSDSGALLDDDENLREYINDAQEQVVLDLMSVMPEQFRTSENISLIAGTQNYTLTNRFWQVEKVERNVDGDSPIEIEIIDPVEIQYHTHTGDTDSNPHSCYFIGDTIYFVPIPSESVSNYAKVWLRRPEPTSMAVGGPSYIPDVAHRLIVYQACAIIATMLEKDPSPYMTLYARRYQMVIKTWSGRFQSKALYVRPGSSERQAHYYSSEDRDVGW